MNELINNQFKILFVFFISGVCIALLFDIFRIQRKIFRVYDFITYIQDILFWIISGLILIFVTMKYTNGELRAYMLLGILLGVILYLRCISHIFIGINTWVIKLIANILKVFFSPIKKIYKIIKKSWKNKNNML